MITVDHFNRIGVSSLPADAAHILLASGKLVGEGFDHPPLDTLVPAMPVSRKGTLQRYAGRLHRQHAGKADVRIIDFVDTGHPALLRMWVKRQRGYRAMGYRLATRPRAVNSAICVEKIALAPSTTSSTWRRIRTGTAGLGPAAGEKA